ncbi:proline dehydrogenase family protein, partial [SCandidatus Aminicenantes bacterium Aminicenantia_JdfR_composite]|nr:proline dehydrogenase family protein [SCandidatus Aminicenantes bacterium Aminicenantia_JdfR_composite]
MRLLTKLASAFVAGETPDEAMKVVKRLNEKNITGTLDVLGENVTNKEEADRAVQAYLDLLDTINQTRVRSYVSLKLTQMGLDIDDEYCYQNMVKIVEKAKKYNNFVRIDMEGSDYTQKTLDIFYRLHKEFNDSVGIVIQAYLFRSEKDIEDLNKIKARVRLCKGAYKEPPTIAYKKMKDIRKNFIKLAEMLFSNGNYPAIATHDDYLIDWTKNFVKEMGISNDKFEFQMLYGIRTKTQEKLAKEGYNIRIYIPFGTHWLPYFYRRLRERKENVWFVV